MLVYIVVTQRLLEIAVRVYMTQLFHGLVKEEVTLEHLHEYATDDAGKVATVVDEINKKDEEVYVDRQALKWWLEKQRRQQRQRAEEQYSQAKSAVARLFSGFKSDSEDCFCIVIVEEFYQAYRKLYNISA